MGVPEKISLNSPTGLMIEFLRGKNVENITTPNPYFSWIVNSPQKNDSQYAYQILVSNSEEILNRNEGNLWNSMKTNSEDSINVPYEGKPLDSNSTYFWKIRTWCQSGEESDWSEMMEFKTGLVSPDYFTVRHPLQKSRIYPTTIIKKGNQCVIDFGKVAFGYLELDISSEDFKKGKITIHFAERGTKYKINKKPGGNVRYSKQKIALTPRKEWINIHPPRIIKNTSNNAIILPEEIGSIAPFRYIQIDQVSRTLKKEHIAQISIHYPFDEDASSFHSSNSLLDQIWELCKYSMKATSFCGIYVDGDRERLPYEADAYINQMSHYAVDREYSIARYSHEYLLTHPTWPTEWTLHSVFIAWMDYLYTGNINSIRTNYAILQKKTLIEYARKDGLLDTHELQDNVDWPKNERDNYEFLPVNTVINAFYYQVLLYMINIAEALGKMDDVNFYKNKADQVRRSFNRVLFDSNQRVYLDGENASHSSLHANMFALAFNLVPEEHLNPVINFVISKGMACSVYGAQYLLEGLYNVGCAEAALGLLTSKSRRSWYNMLKLGSTITLEAWDNKYKKNQDWNHAWGAAPANIIVRFLMGVRPLEPGFRSLLIQPQPGSLSSASAKIPSIRGPIEISFTNRPKTSFQLDVVLPVNTIARVELPNVSSQKLTLLVDGIELEYDNEKKGIIIEQVGSGAHSFILS